MEIINRPRRTGKTYEIVKLFLKDKKAILLVMNQKDKDRIIKDYAIPKDREFQILFWGEMDHSREKFDGMKGHLYIDNVDAFLSLYFHKEVKVVTSS